MAPALDPLTAIAFVALFAVVVALSLRRPIAGPLALLGTLPFDAAHALGSTTLGSPKVVLLGAAAAGVVRRLDASVLRRPPVLGLVLAATAMLGASLLSAANANDRLEVLRQSLKAAEYLAALALAAVAFANDPDQRPVRTIVAGTALLVSVLACLQLATGVGSVAPVDGMLLPRVAGPIEGPNQLAGYLGLLLPIALAYGIGPGGTALERIAVAAGAGALVLTLSRAGIAAGLVALVTVVALEARVGGPPARGLRDATFTLLAVVVGGVGAFCFLAASRGDASFVEGARAVIARITMGEPPRTGGVGHRGDLWRAALELWRGRPLFGVGAGNFELDLGEAGLYGVRTHANSLYLQALVEGGIPLLAATLGWVYASTVPLLRRLRPGAALVLGAAAGSVALALHQSVDLLAFYPKVGETACVLLGLAAALAARTPAAEGAHSEAAASAPA